MSDLDDVMDLLTAAHVPTIKAIAHLHGNNPVMLTIAERVRVLVEQRNDARRQAEKAARELAQEQQSNVALLEMAQRFERERDQLLALINTPRTDDFFEAVRIEAAHQVARWGVEHDAGKRPEDWISLFVYLLGKATKAHYADDREKLLHHIITVAAVALNWHRNMTSVSTAMRPDVGERPMRCVCGHRHDEHAMHDGTNCTAAGCTCARWGLDDMHLHTKDTP